MIEVLKIENWQKREDQEAYNYQILLSMNIKFDKVYSNEYYYMEVVVLYYSYLSIC